MSFHPENFTSPNGYHIAEINDTLCIGENRQSFLRIVKHIVEVGEDQPPVKTLYRPAGFNFLGCTMLTAGNLSLPDYSDASNETFCLSSPIQPGTQQAVEYIFTLPPKATSVSTKHFWHPAPTEPIPNLTVSVRFAANLLPCNAYEREGEGFFIRKRGTVTNKISSTKEIAPQLINSDSNALKIEAAFLDVAVGEIRGLTWRTEFRSLSHVDNTSDATGIESKLGVATVEKIVSAYQNGASAAYVAEANQVSEKTVRRLWRKYGSNQSRVQP